jgi:hypothetical protein
MANKRRRKSGTKKMGALRIWMVVIVVFLAFVMVVSSFAF